MTLTDLKAVVDRLVLEGHGEILVVTTPENTMAGVRIAAYQARVREAKRVGESYWVYNLRDEPRLSVFEVS